MRNVVYERAYVQAHDFKTNGSSNDSELASCVFYLHSWLNHNCHWVFRYLVGICAHQVLLCDSNHTLCCGIVDSMQWVDPTAPPPGIL